MKIAYASDLHINHYVPFNHNQGKWEIQTKEWTDRFFGEEEGPLLLLGGDYSEWNKQAIWFLEEASLRYDQILLVTGNHDRYLVSRNQEKKYPRSQDRIDDFREQASKIHGVIPCERTIVKGEGYTVAADGLWYHHSSPEAYAWWQRNSNDSTYILGEEVEERYQEALNWYQGLEGKEIDIVLSHVPPLQPPLSPYRVNDSYLCPVPFLAAPHWVCGHMHLVGEFEKAGTRFHMNAVGYPMEKHPLGIRSFGLGEEG